MENLYELTPMYDNAKSFYRKAFVKITENGITLYSYNTEICSIDNNGEINIIDLFSQTTTRHIREFLKQHVNKFNKIEKYRKLIESNYSKKELMKLIK